MNTPKFCKHCKHCVPLTGGIKEKDYSLATCDISVASVDLVTGETRFKFCQHVREDACGHDASFFEPIDPHVTVETVKGATPPF